MSSQTEVATLQLLSEVIECVGNIDRDRVDTWSGKRSSPRSEIILPVRLRPLDGIKKPAGGAFTARTRDICDSGLGVTIPYELALAQQFQVEVFTDKGSWVGPMKVAHCTQTIGGYKVGLQSATASDELGTGEPPSQEQTARPEPQDSDSLSTAQASEEIRRALRDYRLAEKTWGMFGVCLDRQIGKLLSGLAPADGAIRQELRREHFRQAVEGQVHVLLPTGGGRVLMTTQIADISAGGARLLIQPRVVRHRWGEKAIEQGGWHAGKTVVIGLWTQESGTLWLPCRIVHCAARRPSGLTVGLQFVRGEALKDFH